MREERDNSWDGAERAGGGAAGGAGRSDGQAAGGDRTRSPVLFSKNIN